MDLKRPRGLLLTALSWLIERLGGFGRSDRGDPDQPGRIG